MGSYHDDDEDDGLIMPIHAGTKNGIEAGVKKLQEADLIIGHNIIRFDIPALQKVYPWFKPKAHVRDTLTMSNLAYSDMWATDNKVEAKKRKKGVEWIPKQFYGRHSLEAWGYRLGLWKGDYGNAKKAEGKLKGLKGDELVQYVWGTWSQEMQDYCVTDVEVTEATWRKLCSEFEKWGLDPLDFHPKPGMDAIQMEHDVAEIIWRQEQHGFLIDQEKAGSLVAHLVGRRAEIEEELQEVFPPWFRKKGRERPKKSRSVKMTDFPDITVRRFSEKTGKELKPYVGPPKCHYTGGEEIIGTVKDADGNPTRITHGQYTKVKLAPFNPGSRDEVADRLTTYRNWKPVELTDGGAPKVSEEVLEKLPWPEAKLVAEYYTVQKRLGQVSEGNKAWLKNMRSDGRLPAGANTNGAVTGRMTHYGVANVPGIYDKRTGEKLPYGKECRELFTAPKGRRIVGCDADALELRCLAGYMARWDNGAYIETVLNGDKKQGTDMHSQNATALGIIRDAAKTWFYAFIYGAWFFTLGVNAGATGSKNAIIKKGEETQKRFLKKLPALAKLIDSVQKRGKQRGWIKGPDGRRIPIRNLHAALNSLLQGAGSVFMKRALVILDKHLQEQGFVPGEHYEFVANIHDEFQIEVKEEIADTVAKAAEWSIAEAGRFYDFRCPLSGSADIGLNWAETH